MSETAQITAVDPGEGKTALRCPICGQPMRDSHVRGRDRLITGDGPFTVMECVDCKYGFTLPQLGEEELARYYPSEYFDFWGYSDRPGENSLQRLLARFRSWSATRSYHRQPYVLAGLMPGRMLDVGCGSGDLLEQFAKRGWETYGIDPSASAVAAAGKRGARVHQGTLRDQPWPPSLVCAHHVSARARARPRPRRCAQAGRRAGGTGGPAGNRRPELVLLAEATAVPKPLAPSGTAPSPAALLSPSA